MYTPYKMMGSTHYGKPPTKKMLSEAQKTLPTELKEKMVESGEFEGPLNKYAPGQAAAIYAQKADDAKKKKRNK